MAACRVDPMPPRTLPDRTAHDNHTSTKYIGRSSGPVQPSPLDAALLCSKLNLHKREQDALRRSREKRELFRNGQYVPKNAAKSFTATTRAMHHEMTPPFRRRKQIPGPLPMIAEPVEGKALRCQKQQHHAILDSAPVTRSTELALRGTSIRNAAGLTEEPTMIELEEGEPEAARISRERFDLTAALAEIEPHPFAAERHDSTRNSARSQKHDSIDPPAADSRAPDFHSLVTPDQPELQPLAKMPSLPDLQSLPGLEPTPPRRRSSAGSEELDSAGRGRAGYRPGDAAKRRSIIDPLSRAQRDRSTSSSHHCGTRMSRSVEEEEAAVLNSTIPEVDTPAVVQRPQLTSNDRPDWSQRSETGDEARHAFNLHVFSHTEKKSQRPQGALLENSMVAQFAQPKPAEQPRRPSETKIYRGPQNDHLIADAVKIIQRAKKVKRRASVMEFFKKL
ncbi:hypothetical protein DOTSEDRAFT_50071 [Dothistroma septosporum NZE10]|uniref:Uncharacterized protein n=1 Tax=Dothistroma septosporum (strain NZE10 / CBS 128990) TaxID=675120 RepID=N1Q3U0_DOTSN|nr:hypothetical protein DOTSEDRAFT_50071 [Dothistroma septosporum NZE10]